MLRHFVARNSNLLSLFININIKRVRIGIASFNCSFFRFSIPALVLSSYDHTMKTIATTILFEHCSFWL